MTRNDQDRDHNQDRDYDQDRDRNSDHANDNHKPGGNPNVPTPTGKGVAALATLRGIMQGVSPAAFVSGGSGLPMMLFKSREEGSWQYGRKGIVPEPNSDWAVNPLTFGWGSISFTPGKTIERMVPVNQPKPTDLPDTGAEWQDQMTVNMKCTSGADTGAEVTVKATTFGALKAIRGLLTAVYDRVTSNQYGDMIVPIVKLGRDSYQHRDHGRIWEPTLTIVAWTRLEGPAPAPAPQPESPPPAEQPRRRRVA
jgi:hypothetical protein